MWDCCGSKLALLDPDQWLEEHRSSLPHPHQPPIDFKQPVASSSSLTTVTGLPDWRRFIEKEGLKPPLKHKQRDEFRTAHVHYAQIFHEEAELFFADAGNKTYTKKAFFSYLAEKVSIRARINVVIQLAPAPLAVERSC